MNEFLVGVTHGWQDGGNLRCVKLGNVDDLRECGDVCNLRKSNRWWQKSCWWLPDWEVEGVVAAEKDLLVVTRLGKSSRSDGSERCG